MSADLETLKRHREPSFNEQRRWTPDHCGCHACVNARPQTAIRAFGDAWMILCPTCGNKRCPHATHHVHACTNSNEPGQPGSSYGRRP